MEQQVHYCYNCGRRVGPHMASCWFCGAKTQRVIRPSRKCPYCLEPVQPKAVKCPHCGEFLDGRNVEAKPASAPQQLTFVIDKAIIQPGHQLPPGQQHNLLEGPGQGLLSAEGVRRIDGPARPLPPQAPMKALDAPADYDAEIDDDEPLPIVGENSAVDVAIESPEQDPPPSAQLPARIDNRALTTRSRELATRDASSGVPAVAPVGDFSNLPILGSLAERLFKKREKPDVIDATEVEAEDPEGRYFVCLTCATEILSNDNFCYHCGRRHGHNPHPQRAPSGPKASNTPLYVMIALCWVAAFLVPELGLNPMQTSIFRWTGLIGAPILSAYALVRPTGILGRLISFGALILSLAVLYVLLLL